MLDSCNPTRCKPSVNRNPPRFIDLVGISKTRTGRIAFDDCDNVDDEFSELLLLSSFFYNPNSPPLRDDDDVLILMSILLRHS